MAFPKLGSVELELGFPDPKLCLLHQIDSDCIQLDVNAEAKIKYCGSSGDKTKGKLDISNNFTTIALFCRKEKVLAEMS